MINFELNPATETSTAEAHNGWRDSALRQWAEHLHFSPSEGRIWLGDQRVLLMQAETFSELRQALIKTLGIERARGFLSRLGYAAGQRDATHAMQLVGAGAPFSEVLRGGSALHALEGFVSPARIDLTGLTGIDPRSPDYYGLGAWDDSIEATTQLQVDGVATHAACWHAVGYCSGYLSTCGGQPILARELECLAMGSSRCIVVAQTVAGWGDAADEWRHLQQEPLIDSPTSPPPMIPSRWTALSPDAAQDELVRPPQPNSPLMGESAAMHLLRDQIRRVASTRATVLFLGESGVGKSLCAQAVHRASPRHAAPLIEVNCAALPESLLESELFGAERGAYSGSTSRAGRFEAANGGTLFLDEIGTLSLSAQAKLLRILQNGEMERLGSNHTIRTDVRVIAATNEDLKLAIRQGRFREDLFFRLNVFPVQVPPLRERRDDIPALVHAFLARLSQRHGRRVTSLTSMAMQVLLHHDWPGNVRELENTLERAVILADDDAPLDLRHLKATEQSLSTPRTLRLCLQENGRSGTSDPPDQALRLEDLARQLLQNGPSSLSDLEAALTLAALQESGGNVSRAAALLGLTRAQLDYRMKKRPA